MDNRFSKLPYYRWLVFGVSAIATFMATLDSSIVNVALPIIADKLEASLNTVQWVVTAYLLTISSLLPIFGKAGDMFGRRKIFGIGFTAFTLGSLFCGMATNIWLLIAARIFQAIGASMLMANSPGLVSAAFPLSQRGRALGTVGTVVALGSMTGPSLGGILVGILGWQWIFYINIPIGIMGIFVSQVILQDQREKRKEKFDIVGSMLFTIAMGSLLLALSQGQEWGWQSGIIIAAVVIAMTCFILFFWQEKRTASPMLDLNLFKIWPFFAGNLAGMLSFMAMFTNVMLLPFYMQSVLNWTPSQVGIIMTAFPVVLAVVAPLSGHLSDKFGPVILSTAGLLFVMLGLIYTASFTTSTSMWEIALSQAIIGAGSGMFQSPNNSSVMSSVSANQLGVAGGINALVRNVGMVIGIAISVSILENRRYEYLSAFKNISKQLQDNAFLYGYHYALLTGAALALIAAIISIRRTKRAG